MRLKVLGLSVALSLPLYGAYLLNEGFEGTFPPTGWDTTRTSVAWYKNAYSISPGPDFGNYYARVRVSDTFPTGAGEITLTTPILDLSLYPGPETLSFYFRFSQASGNMGPNDTLFVDVLPNGDPLLATPVWYIASGGDTINSMTQVLIGLDAYDGTNIAIRFRFKNADDGGSPGFNKYFWLDVVRVYNPSANNPPTINFLYFDPKNPDSNQSVNVYFTATDSDGSISSVKVYYWYNSSVPSSVMASVDTGSVYVATIPAPNFYSITKFYGIAYDNVGDSTITPIYYVVQGFKTIYEARMLADSDTVQIRGVLTANTFNRPEYIQDYPTFSSNYGGIAVFDYDFHFDYLGDTSLGKAVALAGILHTYNNLREIVSLNSYSTLYFAGVPTPLTLTIPDIGEMYEGMLVRIDNVQFTTSGTFAGNTNYQITDGINNLTVRIDGDTDIPGMTIPTGMVSIIGIVGQYGTTYQLLPRSRADIITSSSVDEVYVKGNSVRALKEIEIYTVSGRLIFKGSGEIRLPRGVYIVKSDRIRTIIVR